MTTFTSGLWCQYLHCICSWNPFKKSWFFTCI